MMTTTNSRIGRRMLVALVAVFAMVATLISLPVNLAVAETDKLTVTLTRTDDLGSEIREGDRLTFRITYKNNTDSALTAFPRESNLSDVVPGDTKNCRWVNLAAGATKQCNFAFHIATAKDAQAGTFTPMSTWDATTDRDGNNVLQAGIQANADPVTVIPVPDPLETPHDYAIGEIVHLATPGSGGFPCHRIPALTQAVNGNIIAAWDGRPRGCGDAPTPNSIVYRISKDNGRSWSKIATAMEGHPAPGLEKYGYSDPSLVVDRETGDIFLFAVKSFQQGIAGSRLGVNHEDKNVIQAAVTKSSDNGETWETPKIITEQVTGDVATWRARFASSGEGIQLRYGEHKGRLLQQYAIFKQGVRGLFNHSVYSDDHGETWHAGALTAAYGDENKVVELSDGTLMMNSRTGAAGGHRYVSYSEDQGETWGPWKVENQLEDPVNNASIIRAYPNAPEGSLRAKVLLFSNAKSTNRRANGHVRISYDDGKTWNEGRQFYAGSMAYSTLTPLADGTYGLLFESDEYQNIDYMKIDAEWLGLIDPGEATPEPTVEPSVEATVVTVNGTQIPDISVTPVVNVAVNDGATV
ncbi:sialidase family protein, partial [Boudabousia marimammalium]